jgi:hypothetical protein
LPDLEAQLFCTTTKLRGEASFIIGGLPNNNATVGGTGAVPNNRRNATTFNNDYRLSFDNSYTGKDLLRGRLLSETLPHLSAPAAISSILTKPLELILTSELTVFPTPSRWATRSN